MKVTLLQSQLVILANRKKVIYAFFKGNEPLPPHILFIIHKSFSLKDFILDFAECGSHL
jgi:hypothetical protein